MAHRHNPSITSEDLILRDFMLRGFFFPTLSEYGLVIIQHFNSKEAFVTARNEASFIYTADYSYKWDYEARLKAERNGLQQIAPRVELVAPDKARSKRLA